MRLPDPKDRIWRGFVTGDALGHSAGDTGTSDSGAGGECLLTGGACRCPTVRAGLLGEADLGLVRIDADRPVIDDSQDRRDEHHNERD